MVTDTIRTSIWDNMVEADRIAKYYGCIRSRYSCQHTAVRVLLALSGGITALSVFFQWVPLIPISSGVAVVGLVVFDFMADVQGKAKEVHLAQIGLDRIVSSYRMLWLKVEDSIVDSEQARAEIERLESEVDRITSLDLPDFRGLIEKSGSAVHRLYELERKRYVGQGST
ncbi:MAG: hypothetical protein OXI13_03575 [Gammaproteobacteria bacterium]|nr:hypothetical protein [Gammaproteobacteria bacterium]